MSTTNSGVSVSFAMNIICCVTYVQTSNATYTYPVDWQNVKVSLVDSRDVCAKLRNRIEIVIITRHSLAQLREWYAKY